MTATAMIAMRERGARRSARPGQASGTPLSNGAQAIIAMLKGSLLLAHAALVACLGAALVIAGGAGLANAAVGGALVIFFFAAGQGVQLLASELDPRTGMGVTLTSYAVRVVLLGLLLAAAMRSERVAELFHPTIFFASVVVVLVGWLTGMFVAYSRLRIPLVEPVASGGGESHTQPDLSAGGEAS